MARDGKRDTLQRGATVWLILVASGEGARPKNGPKWRMFLGGLDADRPEARRYATGLAGRLGSHVPECPKMSHFSALYIGLLLKLVKVIVQNSLRDVPSTIFLGMVGHPLKEGRSSGGYSSRIGSGGRSKRSFAEGSGHARRRAVGLARSIAQKKVAPSISVRRRAPVLRLSLRWRRGLPANGVC